MGHKNKPNRGSLVKQVQDSLDEKLQIGRKKKPDKIAGIAQNSKRCAERPYIRIVPAIICISRAAARADGNAMRRLLVTKIWLSVCASKQEMEKYLKKFRPVRIFTAIGATMQRRFIGNMRDHWNN